MAFNVRRGVGVFSNLFGIQSTSQRVRPTQTEGGPSYSVYSGYLQREEKNKDLAETRARYILYSNFLANTLIVGAGVRYFLDLVAKAKWNAIPSDPDNDDAVEAAEFMMEVLEDTRTPWRRIVRRAAMYKFYGFSIQEWTAKKREDGRFGFLDIEPRAQQTIERWDTDRTGRVMGIVQRIPQDSFEAYIPRGKLVYVVDDSLTDSPEGLGIFRHMVDEINRLKRFEQLEGFGYETDMRGVPIGYAPLMDLQQKVDEGKLKASQAKSMIDSIRLFMEKHIKGASNGVILESEPYRDEGDNATPAGSAKKFSVELLDAGQMGHEAIGTAIERSYRMLAVLLGVEELLLGLDGTGSFAMSKNKTQKLFLLVQSTMRELEEQFQRDLVDVIWALNGLPDELKPKLEAENVQFKDIEEIAGALRDLASAGIVVTKDDELAREVFQTMGLTPPEADVFGDEQDAMITDPTNVDPTERQAEQDLEEERQQNNGV